jgi:apolipoprotein N-acyltransferase
MMTDIVRLREWPIVSFSFFTLGVFAANDFGHGFVHTIGLSFIAAAVIWAVASKNRRRSEKAGVRVQGAAA